MSKLLAISLVAITNLILAVVCELAKDGSSFFTASLLVSGLFMQFACLGMVISDSKQRVIVKIPPDAEQ